MTASNPALARSLYRRLLRELPAGPPRSNMLTHRSPLQTQLRSAFDRPESAPAASLDPHTQLLDQLAVYLASQRKYNALVDRYNPGLNMSVEDRVRLTARRVGMDLPTAR